MIECSQIQSLNTCTRVGVSGHILNLLGTWGQSKIDEREVTSRGTTWAVSHVCAWEAKRELRAGVTRGRQSLERKLERNWRELELEH
jgi:hypothetical protein